MTDPTPVPLAEIEAALDPQRGHRGADVTNDEVSALCKALRKAVEGLDLIAGTDPIDAALDPQRAVRVAAADAAAVRELVDPEGPDRA